MFSTMLFYLLLHYDSRSICLNHFSCVIWMGCFVRMWLSYLTRWRLVEHGAPSSAAAASSVRQVCLARNADAQDLHTRSIWWREFVRGGRAVAAEQFTAAPTVVSPPEGVEVLSTSVASGRAVVGLPLLSRHRRRGRRLTRRNALFYVISDFTLSK